MNYTNPHSCHHCDGIIISLPEDNPDLYEIVEPSQSLLLLRVLRSLLSNNAVLETLERTFLVEVDDMQIAHAVSDGCLFLRIRVFWIEEATKTQKGCPSDIIVE